jgi:quercetin dioxygenase-like cupin family protein
MKITNLEKVEKIRPDMEGAKDLFKQVPLSKDDKAPTFSFRVFTIEPGGHTPYHAHAFEHLNYIIGGTGAVVTESGEHRPVKEGDFVLVLPDEKHQYRNTAQGGNLTIICAVPKEYE